MQVLTGRITADATINTLEGGKQVVNFSIALNHKYKSKDGEKKEKTTFVRCSFWRNTSIVPYLTKGTVVEVTGHISVKAYLDANSLPKASLNFHVNDIDLHGGKQSKTVKDQTPVVAEPIGEDLPF